MTNKEFANDYLRANNAERSVSRFKFVTENKTAISFLIIIEDTLCTNGDVINSKVVDYDKMFSIEKDCRNTLVEILSKAENLNSLSDLSSEDQNALFKVIDKFEPEYLNKYAIAVDDIEQDAIKQVIDRDIVLINQIKSDIVSNGMIKLLTK